MAISFGEPSKYIIRRIYRNTFIYLVLLLIFIIGLVFCFRLASEIYGKNNPYMGWIFLIPYLICIFVLSKVFKYLLNIDSFFRGGAGENSIARELSRLPNTYRVFRSVHINNNKSDIDFVVLGPKGLLTIEAKSHKGEITFDGFQLMKNGQYFQEKDILKQAKQEAASLAGYLKVYGFDGYIKPVIVFSHRHTKMNFGLRPVDKIVYVVQKAWVTKLIFSLPDVSYKVPQTVLEQIISKLVETKNY